MRDGELKAYFGYVKSQPPKDRPVTRELQAELDSLRNFLGL